MNQRLLARAGVLGATAVLASIGIAGLTQASAAPASEAAAPATVRMTPAMAMPMSMPTSVAMRHGDCDCCDCCGMAPCRCCDASTDCCTDPACAADCACCSHGARSRAAADEGCGEPCGEDGGSQGEDGESGA
jgi:hypothetical protein